MKWLVDFLFGRIFSRTKMAAWAAAIVVWMGQYIPGMEDAVDVSTWEKVIYTLLAAAVVFLRAAFDKYLKRLPA